jgi:hypothetical protein
VVVVVVVVVVVTTSASIAVSQLSMSVMTDVMLTHGVPPLALVRPVVVLPSSFISQAAKVPGVVRFLAWHTSSRFAPVADDLCA